MKRFSFLQVALMVAFVVIAASCTVTRGYGDEYYDESPRRGSAYGNQVIVVERDPYTGRYYEVDRYGNYYGSISPYGRYDRYYDNRYYNNRYYGGAYGTPRSNGATQQQQEQRRQEGQKKVNEAREVIKGKRSN